MAKPTITYAEAIALPAGRELDALVAEWVFGLRIVSRKWPCATDSCCGGLSPWSNSKDDHFAPDPRTVALFGEPDSLQPVYEWRSPEWTDTPPGFFFVELVPYYSTDDAAAVSVIRRMAALGWRWCVHDSDSYEADAEQADAEPFYCYFQKATPDGGVAEPEAAGATFALAVARAALGAFCEVEKTNG